MTARFCLAAVTPLRRASPTEEWRDESGLKGLPAAAGLFRVWIGDAETGSGQSVLVVDHRSGEINQPTILNEKLGAVSGKLFVTRLAGGDFHRVGHPGTAAGFDINAEALVFGVGLADDFGNMPRGAFGQGDRGQGGFCHESSLNQRRGLSMQGSVRLKPLYGTSWQGLRGRESVGPGAVATVTLILA